MSQSANANGRAIELVERFAHCLLEESKTDNAVIVKQLASYISHFSKAVDLSKKQEDIFKRFLDILDSSTEKLDPSEISNNFKEEIESAMDSVESGKKCAKYKEFVKMIEENLCDDEENDEEIKRVSESVNTIDPITKLPIQDPVKNKKCGHSYEKGSILQLIAKNSRTRCPIPGCSAANFVTKSDLVPDHALKRLLSQSNAIQKKGS